MQTSELLTIFKSLMPNLKTTELDLQKAASYWGNEAGTWKIGRGFHWTEHPAVQERINKKISGDPQKDPYQFFIDLLISEGLSLPLSRCLTLGCGAGDLERGLSKYAFCQKHDAYDIADVAISRAREQAERDNLKHIHYYIADINRISLPAETYDVVFGIQSVHHLVELEHVFSEIRKTLKPRGFFFLNEFIGPTKFQWTDKQLTIINAVLQILPERYRISVKDRSSIKSSINRLTIAEMNNIDPSEAVRSEEICTLLPQYFVLRQKFDLGGTILHLLLQDIVGNFDPHKKEDNKLLELLFQLEDTLLEMGEISSDFAVIIAQKP